MRHLFSSIGKACLAIAILGAAEATFEVMAITRVSAAEVQTGLSASNSYPLDPMSKSELELAVRILRESGKFDKNVSLVSLAIIEPPKQEVLNFKPDQSSDRKAVAILYHLNNNITYEAIINLSAAKLISCTVKDGVQPMQLEEDTTIGVELLTSNPEWLKGLERRGIKDMTNVHMEMFVIGNPIGIINPQKHRLLRAYPFYRVVGNNSFGEPIEGLSALVNLTTRKVTVHDGKEIIPLGGITSNYFDSKQIGKLRDAGHPIITTLPNGPSFKIDGSEVRWENWRLRFKIDPREGLVLHNIGFEDQGKIRSILYRAGVSEVAVPYGAPGFDWVWRAPIDEGEYGLGRLTTTLRPNHEVPGYATILDVPYANSVGDVKMKQGALAIWEQDAGIIWEHHDDDADRTSTRRGRQLVVAHMFTLGNYDYFIQWFFNQDGSIDVKVTLNGDVLAQAVTETECDVCAQKPDAEGNIIPTGVQRYGTLMAPHIVGINHQHFFCFRLDFDIDGVNNSLYELNVRPVGEGRGHLEQNTFLCERTLLRREQEARRDLNETSSRCWRVVNNNSPRFLGHAPGYLLAPAANAYPYAHPESYNRKRAGFLDHHFWATRYEPNEVYAAGEYPVSSIGGQGLPTWSGEASIEDKDIVLWYVLGMTHTPRVEDWPVMPSTTMGFKILPEGFFKRNPALDLPEWLEPSK